MLFNSYEFLFLFFPVVFLGFVAAGRYGNRYVVSWLVLSSLFFYGWWNPKFLLLLLGSISFNYLASRLIVRYSGWSKVLLAGTIVLDLTLLGIYKYLNFFIDTADAFGAVIPHLDIILPLGISFFTFTQIAYLVDVYKGLVKEFDFVDYLLFVTWFPHLIAGPVLHHGQMMPQFRSSSLEKPDPDSIATGLTIFTIGLAKKVILADNLAPFANRVFDSAAHGDLPMLEKAWFGVLAYTLQIYFDFSGYSDMAIGLSKIFNVRLPLNFNSPYKASDIIDFWRRWHMTLSTFLRDYLYVPLGGNRKGTPRRYLNLMATMLLGGMWHGAGWNFILWGGLHGVYLVVNHAWRRLGLFGHSGEARIVRVAGGLLTFVAVMVAWVPFRAATPEATWYIWSGMLGLNGTGGDSTSLGWYAVGLLVIWGFPNSQQWLGRHSPAIEQVAPAGRFQWSPRKGIAILMGLLFAFSVVYFRKNSQFLYYQF